MFLSHEKCYFNSQNHLELLRTLCCFSALRIRELQGTDLKSFFSVSKCNANEENARPRMLKSFFLSEKVANAIIRVKLKYMKDVFSHEMKCYLQCRRRFHVLETFCKASHIRASMHRITSFRASKNTNAVFSATKQMKRMHGHGCWKASFSVRESC